MNHHNAVEDARAAGLLFLRASAETGRTVEEWIARVGDPVGRLRGDIEPAGQALQEILANEVIVFTGALSVKRSVAEASARAAGFAVAGNVGRKTTILVVGDQDVRRLAGKSISSKQVDAEQLVDQGQSIRIVTESDFRDLIALAAA